MSVKSQGQVWDMECPQTINGVEFRPSHKFVLIAYTDHADHNGKNIWPAVATISKKTGLSVRMVQYLTRDLERMGLLILDGKGPKGTRRWVFSGGQGVQPLQGAMVAGVQSDAFSLGAIPSGAMVAPELNEPPTVFINSNNMNLFWLKAKDKLRATLTPTQFETWLEPTIAIKLHERVVTIGCANDHARAWLTQRITTHAQNLLDHYVVFQVSEKVFEYDEDRDE